MPCNFSRRIALFLLVPLTLSAQVPREYQLVPLRNWPTPLYWQPAATPEANSLQIGTTNPPVGSTALVFVAMTPCRVVDTRQSMGFTGAFGPPSIAAGLRIIPIKSSTACSISSLAQAYSFNVTVIPPGSLLFLTLYQATAALPNASTINDPSGTIIANAAIVPAGTDGAGSVEVFSSGTTDLIIDINGYYAPPGDLNGNFALGVGALANNTTGNYNTANGSQTLQANTTGSGNTATGTYALQKNTIGMYNTATGAAALDFNTTGSQNTADGVYTLTNNTTGGSNTAMGFEALPSNTNGSNNTAVGSQALLNNTTGSQNTSIGFGALYANSAGGNNTAIGLSALRNLTSGSSNIAVGLNAAMNIAGTNSDNIHIGNPGSANDNNVIKIGTSGTHTSFFAAGIRGATTGNNDAIPVVVDSSGQLGTISSSARFKEDIRDMGEGSRGLLQLRPVTFRYRQPFADGSKPVQYGLIAEEVEKILPELVARSADGEVESVKYQMLDSMLLNELQRQVAETQKQTEENRREAKEIEALKERLVALESLLSIPGKSSPDPR